MPIPPPTLPCRLSLSLSTPFLVSSLSSLSSLLLPPPISPSFFSAIAEEFMSLDKGRPLPKFGEWDVNDPASAEGFTVIFNKARDEKKTGGNAGGTDSPGKDDRTYKQEVYATKPAKKWFCCIQASPAQP